MVSPAAGGLGLSEAAEPLDQPPAEDTPPPSTTTTIIVDPADPAAAYTAFWDAGYEYHQLLALAGVWQLDEFGAKARAGNLVLDGQRNVVDSVLAGTDLDEQILARMQTGEPAASEGTSIVEGVGISYVTENVARAQVDVAWTVSDEEALPYVFDLLKHEGLCLGGSSALNIAGAVRLAEHLGPGHTIVTILCDYGNRYQSKLFNPVFLRKRGLPVPEWLDI